MPVIQFDPKAGDARVKIKVNTAWCSGHGERKVPCAKLPISPPTLSGSARKTETQIGGASTLR